MLVLSGLALAAGLLVIPQLPWGPGLFAALGLAGLAMAFRMAPLLALTTELVPPQERGTLLVLRNALGQLGIAISAFAASYCYRYAGYSAVGLLSSSLILVSTLFVIVWVREPVRAA